eukprot:c18902_g2_i1 orf=801-4976(+)
MAGEEGESIEEKQSLHELCRGAFEPLRSAIHSELMLLPGCRLLYEDGGCATNGNINREAVLEHIILDMTGSPSADADDVSLQRTLRRTKRLLTRSNSVLLFRLVIMVLVACMLMFTTLLTWNFTRTFSARSIKNLSFALRRQILNSSLNSIAFVLNQAYTMSLSLSLMHQQTLVTLCNGTWTTIEDEVRSVNWRFFESERHLHSVAFLSRDGLVTDYTRGDHSEYLYFVNNSTVGMNTSWYSQSVSESLNGYGLEPPSKSSDGPFQERFLVDLLAQHDVMWSMDTGASQKQFVSSAVPVINPQTKQFLGMSIVTTTLKDVHHYLRTIDLLGGYLYFFRLNASGDSTLVATSYTHPNDIYMEPDKASNVYVAEAATYLQSVYGNHLLHQNETHSEDVTLNGKQFYIDTMPLENWFKFLDLTAVILVPRASIMGEMDARSKTVIKVSVGAALGVLVVGFTLVCVLTRRMSTEMQLRQELIRQLVAKHKAEQSSNHKTQFLANMSHEMRTPMAGIIGLLDLLACDTLTPDQEMSVAQIRRCATGLLALVNNVLDISKVEAGKMELEVAPFNVAEELESLVDMFAAQSLGSDVDVTLDLSDEIPPVVKGDVARIRQIFTNLLSNSVKFTESGHILVRGWTDQSLLTMSRKSVENSFQEVGDGTKVLGIRRSRSSMGSESHRESDKIALAFEIDDTGCGIPATLQETVFDRFVQADSSTTRSHGGSGLGLYIVRSLVNMMGGDVQVAPKSGPGTCMRFYLVLEKVSDYDGAKVGFCLGKPPTSLEDSLSAFVGSPAKTFEEERIPSPEFLTHTQALVALPDSVTRTVALSWFQRRGLSVTSVNKWEDIIPALNKLCRSSVTEGNFLGLGASSNMKDVVCGYAESPASPFALPSGGSSSCVSEITSEWSRRPVLALLDLGLAPCTSLALCNSGLKDNIGNMNSVSFGDFGKQKVLNDLKLLVNALQRLQARNDVLVAWVAPPNIDPLLKQALQSLPSSVVLKKPLHSTRMRRLLLLLAEVCKPDREHAEAFSYTSSDPSTPRLTGRSSPFKEAGNAYNNLNSESEYLDHGMSGGDKYDVYKEMVLPANTSTEEHKGARSFPMQVIREDYASNVAPTFGSPQSSFQKQLIVRFSSQSGIGSEDSPSTPESPTSGLITPEGANSMADGVQEVKKDSGYAKDLENEWKGPVIDLKLPSKSKGTLRYMKATNTVLDQSSTVVSASESPSTTEPPSPPGSNRNGGLEPGVLSGIHILLVEDTPVLQRLASMMLKKLGAEVTVVGDGLQAVEAVAQVAKPTVKHPDAVEVTDGETGSEENFDLILMDCAMPVMDGYGATKAIREAEVNTGRHIPIVALTAHALASDEERCLAVGMDAYLTKPINCKQLVSTVHKLVSKEDHHL